MLRQHRCGQSGRIYSLAVRSDCRGQKLGRKLLDHIMDRLLQRGVRRVYLEVEQSNTAAVALYESAGFRRIGTLPDYYGTGRPGLHMLRQTEMPAVAAPAAA